MKVRALPGPARSNYRDISISESHVRHIPIPASRLYEDRIFQQRYKMVKYSEVQGSIGKSWFESRLGKEPGAPTEDIYPTKKRYLSKYWCSVF